MVLRRKLRLRQRPPHQHATGDEAGGGRGNVLPYALLQGYAVIVLLLMAALHRSRYTRARDLYFIFGWYVLAKLLELFDAEVLAYSHLVSGHSLKHVAAAAAGVVACRMLMQRTLAEPGREA